MKVKQFVASVGLGAILASIAALLFFGAYAADFRSSAQDEAMARVLEASKRVAKAPERVVDCPPVGHGGSPGLVVPDLPPKVEDRIRRDHGVPAGRPQTAPPAGEAGASPAWTFEDVLAAAEIGSGLESPPTVSVTGPKPARYPLLLTETTIKPGEVAYGGAVAGWLGADGRAFLTLAPTPRPFFDFDSRALELGGLWGADSAGNRWRGWAAWEPVRVGDFHLRAEVGADGRTGSTEAYWLLGATWRPDW